MTVFGFLQRLENGKVNNITYSNGDAEGLVCVWKHEATFVLTWEECARGRQYDESEYSRDERHIFDTTEALLAFLSQNSLPIESFTP